MFTKQDVLRIAQVVLSVVIVVLVVLVTYGIIHTITTENPEDFVEGVVVSYSLTSDGRFGVVLFVDGKMRAYSTGAEGEGFRMCDTVKLYCEYENDRCVGRELLSKFIGTEEECIASLIERGILSK